MELTESTVIFMIDFASREIPICLVNRLEGEIEVISSISGQVKGGRWQDMPVLPLL